jgi:glycosyltransferase involved in cell wall biosynthesis
LRRELASAGIDATVVPLGVRPPATSFRRAPTRAPTFAYCGRLSREKGVAVLIAAFAKCVAEVPAARLRIVGDGPLKGELVSLAAVLGISRSVDFAGWQTAAGVDEALANVWALVAPSLWAEPFGLIAIEAMLRGVPVVASDSGGFRENIEAGESGLLFLPGSIAALTDRLVSIARRKVFSNHRLDEEIVKRVAETYSMEKHVTRMRQVFSEVTAA